MELSTPNREEIYDGVRGIWVLATPEEIVRQNLLKRMINGLLYPKELIAVEKSLSEISFTQAPTRRIDIVCFAKNIHPEQVLSPLLLIECKRSKQDAQKALDQVKGYNRFVKAHFIAVAYPEGELLGFCDTSGFNLVDYLPRYSQLLQAIYHGR